MRGRFIRNYWESVVLGIVIFGGIGALSFYSNQKVDRLRRERDRNGVDVIGLVTSENNDLKGALVVDYCYRFAARTYANSIATNGWVTGNQPAIQKRFYVRVAVINP